MSVKQVDDGKYEMTADLTIKGITKRLTLPFQLKVDQGDATARTETTINRLDFKLGPNEAVAGMIVADAVRIVVEVAATRLDN